MSATEYASFPRHATARPALPAILIAAVIQGWALFGLHEAIQNHHWPATRLGWLLGLYALTVLAPSTLQLLVEHLRKPAFGVLLTLLGVLAFYFGWQHGSAVTVGPLDSTASPFDFFAVAFVLLVWWLHVLPFLQNRLVAGRGN